MTPQRPDPFERPLDALLERLRVHSIPHRPHHEHVDRWLSVCPACRRAELVIQELYEGGAATVRCADGCHEQRIVQALAGAPSEPDRGLDLAEDAADLARQAFELLEASWR